MTPNSKIVLLLISSFFVFSTAPASEFTDKRAIVDKHLKGKISFEKKVKVLSAFQIWVDRELRSRADKLNDDELTQTMQFSTLLRATGLKKLTPKNCKSAMDRVIDEDLTPVSDDLSPAGMKLMEWLQLICPKSGNSKKGK